ncbi:MAG: HAMP domain-containing protein [Desulfobulbaceae bacterium]|nr:HAMP domain-containing protein [Desulfobulbaceae bacterium]
MTQPRKKLGSYLIAAFFINIFAIMSVGALCILLVSDILHNIKETSIESKDVFKIDHINNQVYQIIYAIDKAELTSDLDHLNYARDIVTDTVEEVSTFILERQSQSISEDEGDMLGSILTVLKEISSRVNLLLQNSDSATTLDRRTISELDRLSVRVQLLSDELREYHSPKISGLVGDSKQKMESILLLYLLSSSIGIFASIVGYIVLTRNTVAPILGLARATREVAKGDLTVRVSTDSETEIGALYAAFNAMTGRLEEYEREHNEFNHSLEVLVEERTSELREANASLRKAQSELVRMEKIAALGQIAASVNHEIKTPLNSLYLNLQLLTRKINKLEIGEEKTRDSLLNVTSVIDNEIQRISEILEEFVQYARFAPPDLKRDDLNAVVRNLAEMIGENASQSRVSVALELSESPLPVLLDRKKITQALLNLAVNAIHAMPAGGKLTLTTHLAENGEVALTVADTGTGIGVEDLERIFEPFFTKKEKGMGFGLAIVKRIIEDHHGAISCKSQVGEFTEFIITLPPVVEAGDHRPAPAAENRT